MIACHTCRRWGAHGCRLTRFWDEDPANPDQIRGHSWMKFSTPEQARDQLDVNIAARAYRAGKVPVCTAHVPQTTTARKEAS